MFKRWSMLIGSTLIAAFVFLIVWFVNGKRPAVETAKVTSQEIKASGEGIQCHMRETPAITKQFRDSRHAVAGVTCLDCHKAADDEHSTLHNGFKITRLVTSGACSRCHIDQYREFSRSRHGIPAWSAVAGIGDFTKEQIEEAKKYHPGAPTERGPNALAIAEGGGAIENGCAACHNIGQPNYDKSIGNCTKCHGRHEFSVEMARTPETCGSCHMGPDHAQLEIYYESKHGVQFRVRRDRQDLTVRPKDLTVEHQDVPTCSTCHMSGLGGIGMTHDVGERLSYYLFAPVSTKRPHAEIGMQKMKQVCLQCHAATHVEEFYKQAELVIPSTNEKVKKVEDLEKELRAEGLLTPKAFDEPIEFLIFNHWHHWGRTVKHGAYMGGPDFTQWHGNYEMLKDWVEIQHMAEELREKSKKGEEPAPLISPGTAGNEDVMQKAM